MAVDLSNLSDKELVQRLDLPNRTWLYEPCAIGVPVLAELLIRQPGQEAIRMAQLEAEMLCDAEEARFASGTEKLARLEAAMPDRDFTWIGLQFALRLNDESQALRRIGALDSARASRVEPELFWHVIRMVRREGMGDEWEDTALSLHKSGMLDAFDVELQSTLAYAALGSASRNSEEGAYAPLLGYLRAPDTYVEMLADRELAPVWPLIAERAGTNLEQVSRENVEWSLSRLENDPSDEDRLSDAMHALHYAGRFEEVVAKIAPRFEADPQLQDVREGDAWALNLLAYAYDSLGQPKHADRVFDALARLDPETHDWVVNFVINRASRLVGQERWGEGLEAAGLARTVAESYGSTFAKLIVARDHACALPQLGRADEVEAELVYLRENAADSASLAATGLLCAGLEDEAVALLMTSLDDNARRPPLLDDLQPSEFDLFYTASKLPHPRDLLVRHPELKAKFELYARIVPNEFVPAAALRRRELTARQ